MIFNREYRACSNVTWDSFMFVFSNKLGVSYINRPLFDSQVIEETYEAFAEDETLVDSLLTHGNDGHRYKIDDSRLIVAHFPVSNCNTRKVAKTVIYSKGNLPRS